MLKLPVGVCQPDLPEAMGDTSVILPRSTNEALCSDKLMITLVSAAIPAFPTVSNDRAITTFINVFILILGCSRQENPIGVNADLGLICEIAVSVVLLLTNRKIGLSLLDQGVIVDANCFRTRRY